MTKKSKNIHTTRLTTIATSTANTITTSDSFHHTSTSTSITPVTTHEVYSYCTTNPCAFCTMSAHHHGRIDARRGSLTVKSRPMAVRNEMAKGIVPVLAVTCSGPTSVVHAPCSPQSSITCTRMMLVPQRMADATQAGPHVLDWATSSSPTTARRPVSPPSAHNNECRHDRKIQTCKYRKYIYIYAHFTSKTYIYICSFYE